VLTGDGGADHILAGLGSDVVYGGTANDTINGGGGDDTLDGGTQNDVLVGQDGSDLLYGDEGADTLDGGDGNDVLEGGADNDVLRGRAGEDELAGGLGLDFLTGGADADAFVFRTTAHAGIGATRDQILDFEQGLDLINVVSMSAGVFSFIGTDPFTAINQIRVIETATGSSIVQFNTDADLTAEAELRVGGVTGLTMDDFAL
jgi:serralysin